MKKFGKLFLSVTLTWMVLSGCSKDDIAGPGGDCGLGLLVQIADEASELSVTSSAYNADPNPNTCAAYKKAYTNYLNAVIGYSHCYSGEELKSHEYNIESYKQDIAKLCQ